MDAEVLTVLLGIALAALVAACGAGFRWLRSDFRDLRNHVDTRFTEQSTTTNARFDRLEDRFDRLEARFDELIMALARAGTLIDPQVAPRQPSPPPSKAESVAQPSDPEQAPAGAPTETPSPAGAPPEIADPPRAPPATGDQPPEDPPSRSPPPESLGPTTAPA